MSASPADEYRDPGLVSRLNRVAAGILAKYGVDFIAARRAGGWTNTTWLAGGLALRLSPQQGEHKIRREARLGALLPLQVGYPVLVESGETEGHEWALSRQVPGRNLGEAWDSLDWDVRTAALRQLWEKVQAVHSVPAGAAAGLARERPWFNATDPELAWTTLTRLGAQGLFSNQQADNLAGILEVFWLAQQDAERVLNHGDVTLDNVLWLDGQVTALLDFEFAVLAPPELDLNGFIRMAFDPGEDGVEGSGEEGAGSQSLKSAVVEMTAPLLSRPGAKDRLAGYALLLELWLLEDWLMHPEGEGPLETWQPYRRLLSLADGRGGYLSRFIK